MPYEKQLLVGKHWRSASQGIFNFAKVPLVSVIIAIAVTCLVVSTPAAPQTVASPTPGVGALPPAPVEQKEWYEHGMWPLAGSLAAIIVANGVAIFVVYLQASRSFEALLRQRRIERLSSSLTEFYDPLLALVEMNGQIFKRTGPPSFPEEHVEREAAALVWKETKLKILSNNAQIESILRTKTHLLHRADSIQSYSALMLHVAMYETFQKVETDIYADFRFPQDIRDHINAMRSKTLDDYDALSGERT
jgi:hypothetical protein